MDCVCKDDSLWLGWIGEEERGGEGRRGEEMGGGNLHISHSVTGRGHSVTGGAALNLHNFGI